MDPYRKRIDSDESIDVDVDKVLWSDDPEKAYFQGMMDEKRQSRLDAGGGLDDSVLGEQTLASLEERKAPPNPFKKSKNIDYIPTYQFDTDSESGHRPTDMAYVGETDDLSTLANDTLGNPWVSRSNARPQSPERLAADEDGERPTSPPSYIKYPFKGKKTFDGEEKTTWDRRKYKYALAVGVFLICAIVALSIGLGTIRARNEVPSPIGEWTDWTLRPTGSPIEEPKPTVEPVPTVSPMTEPPTISKSSIIFETLQAVDLVQGTDFAGSTSITDSPQEFALDWLANDPDFFSYDISRILQRYSLAVISQTIALSSNRRHLMGNGALSSWMTYTDECTWFGDDQDEPACDKDGNLKRLILPNQSLDGTMPLEISLLNKLVTIDLANNSIFGNIPDSIGALVNLVELYLDNNSLEGKIPKGIGGLKKLDILDLSNNALTGAIPKEVGKLKTLDVLNMANNQLSGLISGDLGKLINLKILDLRSNQLSGAVPLKFSELFAVEEIQLVDNNLIGSVPIEMCALNFTIFSVDCEVVTCTCCTTCESDVTQSPTLSPAAAPTLSPVEAPASTPSPTIQATPGDTLQPTPDVGCINSITTNKTCYEPNEEILVTFRNCEALGNDWIGFYPEGEDLEVLGSNPGLWVWSCGDQSCRFPVENGFVVLDEDSESGLPWPLQTFGLYQVFLVRRGPYGGPYPGIVGSAEFSIEQDCSAI